MILCDMDGVLATGPGMDTARGEPIYRTFTERPEELGRIRAAGISLHIVTAKVEAEATQVLQAIELDEYITSVISADRLFWPSVWAALRRKRLPNRLSKIACGTMLPEHETGRVVMLEDRREHLCDMLAAEAIDFGVLVPPIVIGEGRIVEWFDLNLALRVAKDLSLGDVNAEELSRLGISIDVWEDGWSRRLDWTKLSGTVDGRGYLLRLPRLTFANCPSPGPSLKSLDTGHVLTSGGLSVVGAVRAGRRVVRQIVARLSTS